MVASSLTNTLLSGGAVPMYVNLGTKPSLSYHNTSPQPTNYKDSNTPCNHSEAVNKERRTFTQIYNYCELYHSYSSSTKAIVNFV